MATMIWGFIFGGILQYARLNRFDTIAGMAVLKDFAVAKTISFATGLGLLLLQADIYFGWADYHIKFLILTGIIIGGLLFGARMGGGGTSGHIISAGMQFAFSSMLFAITVFAAFLTTGHYFYRARAGI